MVDLTAKELSLLTDTLTTEQLLVKRFQNAAASCCDPTMKQQFEQTAQRHQQHFNTLQSYLR
ncbi:MAG: hypothetical protein IJC25_01760 [Clostridia bacterium]|nr:hypothetical protein [Clostridia bacterium]